ncbi:chromatin-remodeling protein 11 [Perilla frutescens var. frutescens]|nr:chromatin-remodeling protein 11 [Perilla frutescens var. frutescens]
MKEILYILLNLVICEIFTFLLYKNNLHELWALLNFLLPEIFSSAVTFDEWFQISGDNDEHEVVDNLTSESKARHSLFGAEMVFSSKDSTITDEDIDRIFTKGEEATSELDAKMKKFTEDAIKFKIDDTADLYDFDDEKFDFKKIVSDNWIEPPKRERKRNYSESEYFKQTMRQSGPARPNEPRIPRMPQLHDFQFFNTQRSVSVSSNTSKESSKRDTIDVDEPEAWSIRDFNAFIRACEKYGWSDIRGIASEMEGITEDEVERYAKVFKERYKELNGHGGVST